MNNGQGTLHKRARIVLFNVHSAMSIDDEFHP